MQWLHTEYKAVGKGCRRKAGEDSIACAATFYFIIFQLVAVVHCNQKRTRFHSSCSSTIAGISARCKDSAMTMMLT